MRDEAYPGEDSSRGDSVAAPIRDVPPGSDWYEAREQQRALRTYADQVVLLPCVGRERQLAENIIELLDEIERLRALVTRAEYIALHLHAMIDRETWLATGGDNGQGHYEGDYHAEKVAAEIRSWTR